MASAFITFIDILPNKIYAGSFGFFDERKDVKVVRYIYSRPLSIVGIVIFFLVVMWTIINRMVNIKMRRKQISKCLNFVLSCWIIITILYLTILSRNIGKYEVSMIPFYSFVMAQEQPEMYRSMLMNVLLFVPFGLFVPYVLKKSYRAKIKFTIMSAFLFSVCIEVLQGIFLLGRAEIDDVICNTLGAFIGSLSFVLYSRLERTGRK